jgi:hypothetical protein
MNRRAMATLSALALAIALAGCSPAQRTTQASPIAPPPVAAPGGDAAGSRLAPGLYDQADGTVLALGTLEWSDLEGGFWAVVGGTQATGDVGKVVAVIPNVAKDDPTYAKLAGSTVQVTGKRLDGASVRNAGPEITATSIAAVSDTGGPAE